MQQPRWPHDHHHLLVVVHQVGVGGLVVGYTIVGAITFQVSFFLLLGNFFLVEKHLQSGKGPINIWRQLRKSLQAIEGSEPENLIDRVQGKREDAVQRFKENNNWHPFKATQILSMRFFVYRIMYKPIFQALEHHKQFQYIEQAEVERLDPKCDQWLSGVFHYCNLSFLAAALISDSTRCVFEVRVSLVAESF